MLNFLGVIAQLGERYNGIVEVGGSIPPGSTRCNLFILLDKTVLVPLPHESLGIEVFQREGIKKTLSFSFMLT